MEHHDLDIDPIPKESKPLFINEPWLIDRFLQWIRETGYDPTPLPDDDNIRVYLPMDICKSAILRRLADVISLYGHAAEANEMDFSYDVNSLISQIEIYDQVWFVRHCPKHGRHSTEAIDLVKEFVRRLEDIPIDDAVSSVFPFFYFIPLWLITSVPNIFCTTNKTIGMPMLHKIEIIRIILSFF